MLAGFFPSLPPIIWGKYAFHTLVLFSDELTGAREVVCDLVVMVD